MEGIRPRAAAAFPPRYTAPPLLGLRSERTSKPIGSVMIEPDKSQYTAYIHAKPRSQWVGHTNRSAFLDRGSLLSDSSARLDWSRKQKGARYKVDSRWTIGRNVDVDPSQAKPCHASEATDEKVAFALHCCGSNTHDRIGWPVSSHAAG